jgi:murein endopeptidase
MPLEQAQSAVDGYTINLRINLSRVAQNLARIQMLLGSLHDAQNGAPLAGHAQSTRHQLGLQAAWNLSLWKWQGKQLLLLETQFQDSCNDKRTLHSIPNWLVCGKGEKAAFLLGRT